MATNTDDVTLRTLSSALATLSLAQAFMLDELQKLSPEGAKRVADSLRSYAIHVEERNGPQSIDAATTRVTVAMLTRQVDEDFTE
ncbi:MULTISPECIES: hypothetical protein [Acidovorax]|uniref:hypothetical protein n=1 Tax=Acidovorax TaxID=12916 RepID=UPI0002377151|nr:MULTISPECIES: hypothetical protein [Acidovorax]KRD25524.1 hypothetical protein ASE39_21595 [Acidovorax sp. Root267]